METLSGHGHFLTTVSSYRTYEEWKQEILDIFSRDLDGSYRTYEEWKREGRP